MRLADLQQARGFDHVVLSPHPDDAALSCGGRIAAHRASGQRVLVVTIATADPPAEVALTQPSAPWSDTARRRDEDERAMALLGVDHLWVGLLDAPLRRPDLYGPPHGPFRPPAADDPIGPAVDAIVRALRASCPQAVLHAPLAVGGHVDHLAVRAAALAAADVGARVALYEDFPYALDRPPALGEALRGLGRPATPRVEPVGPHLPVRIAAIECYVSQIEMLFGSVEAMRAAVARAAAALGPVPAERAWLVGRGWS